MSLAFIALLLTGWYGETVLPFYRWEVSWIAPSYEIRTFEVDRSAWQPRFRVVVEDHEFIYNAGELHPGAMLECQVLVMNGLQHVVLVLLVPLAWPGLKWKRRLVGLAFAIPILCCLEFADIPLAIVGDLDTAKADLSSSFSSSFATVWREILATGGRLALGLAGGLIACGLARLRPFSSNMGWQPWPLPVHDVSHGVSSTPQRRRKISPRKLQPGSAK